MPSQVLSSVENNFTKGLVTEFTGLNFPENAATDTDNCVYTLVGDVLRREGIDKELNGQWNTIKRQGATINSYKWNNAGGDGNTQVVVLQAGTNLYFYRSYTATAANPVSTQLLSSVISLLPYATGLTPDPATQECQFTDGNGYLFVLHPSCEPLYCTYVNGNITASPITIKIRDFVGLPENLQVNQRPTTLTTEHNYNLTNQGWTQGSPWFTSSLSNYVVSTGSKVFVVDSGLTVGLGDFVSISNAHAAFPGGTLVPAGTGIMSGTVTAYSGTLMTINVVGTLRVFEGSSWADWLISPINHGYINTWQTAIGNYPSNADVWWYFKDNTGAFNPTTTVSQVSLNTGFAPKGHYLLSAFDLDRSLVSGIAGITEIGTSIRPRTGSWFQGRVWYAGVDDAFPLTGDVSAYAWTENIYFSQIINDATQFGNCYQANDPTSETLFDLLPNDGGLIRIQGSGAVYRLFPIQNGMLVFAANGIWFITGSQGIGFTANDYTITKISAVQSISSTSFVDVQGLPYFWNEEGIYMVSPSQQGGLTVEPITVGTILQFYNDIPRSSKQYVRGAYHPIDYIIQWTYKSTDDDGDITARYQFDKVLVYNTYNKAFYPYTISEGADVSGIIYVASPGSSTGADPAFKYLATQPTASLNFTFAEEYDDSYVDWKSMDNIGVDYNSYFVTGYKLHGQGQRRFQIPYLYVFSKAETPTAYKIQSLWDYATSGNSGKWSSYQQIYNNKPYFGMIFRRHRLRGQGLVLQIKITSVPGMPFDVMGWSTYEMMNASV